MKLISQSDITLFDAAMKDLEDTFAHHTIVWAVIGENITELMTTPTYTKVNIKCIVVSRTEVDESDTMRYDSFGFIPHQQIEVYVFKREALLKNIIDTNGIVKIGIDDIMTYKGAEFRVEQVSDIGHFSEVKGELVKIRLTQNQSKTT